VTTDESYGEQNQRLVARMVDWRPNAGRGVVHAERTVRTRMRKAMCSGNVFEEAATPRDYNAAGIPFSTNCTPLLNGANTRRRSTTAGPATTSNRIAGDASKPALARGRQSDTALDLERPSRLDWGSWQDFDARSSAIRALETTLGSTRPRKSCS